MNNQMNKASNSFEKLYNPSKQNFNLESRREKNIKEIESLIEEMGSLDLVVAKEKRDIVAASETKTDEEINNEIKELEINAASEKLDIQFKIKEVIKKQAKYLLILKDSKDVYEYYKLITSMPLNEEYAELESNVYREFLMSHKDIENIIISYFELDFSKTGASFERAAKDETIIEIPKEDETVVEDSVDGEAIIEIPEAEETIVEEPKVEETIVEEPKEKNKDANIETAKKAREYINKMKENYSKEYLKKATTEIAKLPEGEVKRAFKNEIVKFVNKTIDNFKELYSNLCITQNVLLESDVRLLVKMFDFLATQHYEDINFNKSDYTDGVKDIVDRYNEEYQVELSRDLAVNKDSRKKYGFATLFIEFMGAPAKWILNSKKYQEKLESKKAAAESYEELDAIESKIQDSDIVSGPRFYAAKNILSKIKPVLVENYFNKENTISQRVLSKFEKAGNIVSDKIRFMVEKSINYEKVLEDRDRIHNVAKQALEAYAESRDVSDYKTFERLINESYKNGGINDPEVMALLGELNNINSSNDNIPYEVNFKEVLNAEEYYKKPVKYEDSEGTMITIPYIKRK